MLLLLLLHLAAACDWCVWRAEAAVITDKSSATAAAAAAAMPRRRTRETPDRRS